MPNTVQVIFEIDKDSQGRNALRQIDRGIDQIGKTAKQTGTGIESALNVFKGAAIVEVFRRGAQAAFEFGKTAVDAFNQAQNAALGLQSVARFKGLDPQSTSEAVKNLDLVKNGLLTVGEASAAVKNLLASGFNLEQSIQLVNRFGDSAAFGKQAALSFGQAVVSATEGIKNGNCVTGDTLVLTDRGEIPIANIVLGRLSPLVVSFDKERLSYCLKRVKGLAINGVREVYELRLSDGRAIKATPNHRFMTTEGMKFLFEIQKGDDVFTWSENVCGVRNNSKSQPTGSIRRSIVQRPARMSIGVPTKNASNVGVLMSSNELAPGHRGSVQGLVKVNGHQSTGRERMRPIIKTDRLGRLRKRFAASVAAVFSKKPATSKKASEIFAQKNARQRFSEIISAARIARATLVVWKLLVSGAANPLDSCRVSQKRLDSALRNAEITGKAKCACQVRTIQTGKVGLRGGEHYLWQRESIKNGARKYFNAIPIPANGAKTIEAETYTPITSSPLLSILNWQQWLKTELPTAIPVTPSFIKNSKPHKAKVLEIKPRGFEQVYDIEIEDTHTFIGNGILQSNSILVDNAGVTKNISVILKEAGFEMQDLSDRTKKQAATLALYNGLLKETEAQVGDAAKLTGTFAGQSARLDAEYQKLLVTLGEIITKNPDLANSFKEIGTSIGIVNNILKDSESELSKLVNVGVTGFSALVRGAAEFLKDLEGILFLLRRLNAGGVAFGAIQNIGESVFGVDVFGLKDIEAREKAIAQAKDISAQISKILGEGRPVAAQPQVAVFDKKKADAEARKAFEAAQQVFKQLEREGKQVESAFFELQNQLQFNPIVKFYQDAERQQAAFVENSKHATAETVAAYRKLSNDVANLEVFKTVFAQGQNLNSLLNQRAVLEAKGDPEKLARLQKENVDAQLALAKSFLSRSTNEAQRAFANEQILQITQGGNLTSEQIDIRFQALNEQIALQQRAFEENFRRLSEQTDAQKENTFALREVGNRLAAVEGALDNRRPIAIEIIDKTNGGAKVDLGSVSVE